MGYIEYKKARNEAERDKNKEEASKRNINQFIFGWSWVALIILILFLNSKGELAKNKKLELLSEEIDRANRYKITDVFVVDNISGRKEIVIDTTDETFNKTGNSYYYDPDTEMFYNVFANYQKETNELVESDEIKADLNQDALDHISLYVNDNGQIYYTKEQLDDIEGKINAEDFVRKLD